MNFIPPRARCSFLIALLFSAALAGCGHSLFNNVGSDNEARLRKYYGDDSAVETTESRRRTSDMGFGYPTGPANQ